MKLKSKTNEYNIELVLGQLVLEQKITPLAQDDYGLPGPKYRFAQQVLIFFSDDFSFENPIIALHLKPF